MMSMIVLAAALAAAAPEPAPVPAPIAPVARLQKADPASDTRRVCVVDNVTGSRLERKTCQTRAEWVAQGVDPLARR